MLNKIKDKKWTYLSWLIIFLASFLLLMNYTLIPPNFSDVSYHLSVAHGFNRAGGVVTWDFWESLPEGRGHLYPPIFHLILLALLKIGLTPLVIIKLTGFIIYPLSLLIFWWTTKKIFNDFIAAISTLILASSVFFMIFATVTIPGTIALALTPLIFLCLKEKKYWAAFFLLILNWYTHLILPYFGAMAIFIYYLIFDRPAWKKTTLIILGSWLFFLPWFIQVITHLDYLKYLHLPSPFQAGGGDLAFDLVLPAASAIAVILILLWWRHKPLIKPLYFFGLWGLVQLAMITSYPERFFNSGGLIIMSIIMGYLFWRLKILAIKPGQKIILIAAVIFLMLANLVIIQVPNQPSQINWRPTLWPALIKRINDPNLFQRTPYHHNHLQLAELIKQNATTGEETIFSLATIFDHFYYQPEARNLIANFFGSLTGLAVGNPRLPELKNPDLWRGAPINNYDFVIADLWQTPLAEKEYQGEMEKTIAEILTADFELLGQAGPLYLYKNKKPGTVRAPLIRPVMPHWLAFLILIFLISGAILGLKLKTKPPRN